MSVQLVIWHKSMVTFLHWFDTTISLKELELSMQSPLRWISHSPIVGQVLWEVRSFATIPSPVNSHKPSGLTLNIHGRNHLPGMSTEAQLWEQYFLTSEEHKIVPVSKYHSSSDTKLQGCIHVGRKSVQMLFLHKASSRHTSQVIILCF